MDRLLALEALCRLLGVSEEEGARAVLALASLLDEGSGGTALQELAPEVRARLYDLQEFLTYTGGGCKWSKALKSLWSTWALTREGGRQP